MKSCVNRNVKDEKVDFLATVLMLRLWGLGRVDEEVAGEMWPKFLPPDTLVSALIVFPNSEHFDKHNCSPPRTRSPLNTTTKTSHHPLKCSTVIDRQPPSLGYI